MILFFTLFRQADIKKEFLLRGQYLTHFMRVFPKFDQQLKGIKEGVVYLAGSDHAHEYIYSVNIKSYQTTDDDIRFSFQGIKKRGITSGYISDGVHKVAKQHKWLNQDSRAPIVCMIEQKQAKDICDTARQLEKIDAMMSRGEYKDVCMLYAPLQAVEDNEDVWNNADILYRLGKACSKLSTTLLIKAGEVKKLENAKRYRAFCVEFLTRGAEIEKDSARCMTALAYRYYSNVHELMRPGERRDQSLEEQIKKANEFLSCALEIYPQSVKNHYRKGKLIIEKQAPYLLYGKKSFGQGEASLLRNIREVGEEHLASAISIYEELKEGAAKEANRREYAKALFVLGGYYLNDAHLPIHEYFCTEIAHQEHGERIQPIDKLNMDSARENLEKCFYAETEMPIDKLDFNTLAAAQKTWARKPAEKLYRMGCVYSGMAFIALVNGTGQYDEYANTAIKQLSSAKKVLDLSKDKKRNTWHISEKIAWCFVMLGQYGEAARLLKNARSGYVINTYAIALLLRGQGADIKKAKEALHKAVNDKNNLASGLSNVLYAYALSKSGQEAEPIKINLSAKNKKLADILGIKCIAK